MRQSIDRDRRFRIAEDINGAIDIAKTSRIQPETEQTARDADTGTYFNGLGTAICRVCTIIIKREVVR